MALHTNASIGRHFRRLLVERQRQRSCPAAAANPGDVPAQASTAQRRRVLRRLLPNVGAVVGAYVDAVGRSTLTPRPATISAGGFEIESALTPAPAATGSYTAASRL